MVQKMKGNDQKYYDQMVDVIFIGRHEDGKTGVGKSSILQRAKEEGFADTYTATIGVDFKIFTLNVESTKTRLQIWDTAGQERFKFISQSYYHTADVAVFVLDASEKDPKQKLKDYLLEFKRYNTTDNVLFMVVITKSDLATDQAYEALTPEILEGRIQQAQQFLDEQNQKIKLHVVSSKNGTGITALMQNIAESGLAAIKEKEAEEDEDAGIEYDEPYENEGISGVLVFAILASEIIATVVSILALLVATVRSIAPPVAAGCGAAFVTSLACMFFTKNESSVEGESNNTTYTFL